MSESSTTTAVDGASFLVVDIGKKQKRKDIKGLRKGSGKLTEKVKELIDELREQNTISAAAQPVVIVVREKAKRSKLRLFGS